jgi:CRP-like cAMP-binding protein
MPLDTHAFRGLFSRLVEDAPRGSEAHLLPLLSDLEVPPGGVVLSPDQPSDCLLLVVSGRLAVSVHLEGQELALGEKGPGDWAGEVTFLNPGIPSATVRAVEPSALLALSSGDFAALCEKQAPLAKALLHGLSLDLARRVRASHAALWAQRADGSWRLDRPSAARERSGGWLRRVWSRLLGAHAPGEEAGQEAP